MYRTSAKYTGAAALALTAAVLTGCGGGGDQGGTGGQEGEVPGPQPPAAEQQQPPPPEQNQQNQQQNQQQNPEAAKSALQDQINQQLKQHPITFKPDSADLTDESKQTVTKVGEAAKSAPEQLRFQVGGHVAKTGPQGNAQQLSQQRAQKVAEQLTQAGVPAEKVQAVGFGDAQPQGSLEQSRRVEITVQ